MKSRTISILAATGVAFAIGLAFVGTRLFAEYRTFQVEDRIAGTFWPVAHAIEAYHTKTGVVPDTLQDLIPQYLPSLPRSPYVDDVQYSSVPPDSWCMNVHSTSLTPSRVYSWRWPSSFTDDERSRIIKEFHLVTVLRD